MSIAQIKTKLVRNDAQMAELIVAREQILEQLDWHARQKETLKFELALESTQFTIAETKDVAFLGIE